MIYIAYAIFIMAVFMIVCQIIVPFVNATYLTSGRASESLRIYVSITINHYTGSKYSYRGYGLAGVRPVTYNSISSIYWYISGFYTDFHSPMGPSISYIS
jgi:hypothetical protein